MRSAAMSTHLRRGAGRYRLLNSPFNELSLAQYCRCSEEAAARPATTISASASARLHAAASSARSATWPSTSPTMAAGLQALGRLLPAHQQNTTMALRQERELLYLDYRSRMAG